MHRTRTLPSDSRSNRKVAGRFGNSRMGTALLVYVTTHALAPTWAEVTHNGILHIHLQYTPTDEGELNQILVDYLAHILALPPENIEVVAGHHSQGKIVAFYNVSPVEMEKRLAGHFGPEGTPTIW